MQKGFEEAGPRVVIASLLSALLMFMTSRSEMQAIESFGVHAGLAVTFTLVAVGTLYAPALAINVQKHREMGVRCLGCIPECCCPCSVSSKEDPSSTADRCSERLASCVSHRALRLLIIVLFLALAGVSGYFCSKIERERDSQSFFEEGQNSYKYFE